MVTVSFDKNTYSPLFTDEAEAKLFESELLDTVNDFNVNGTDKSVRKKILFANPADCTVSCNFNTANSTKKWEMVAKLSSPEETEAFFKDIKFVIYGPMPSI